jgi:hypothetical protein
VSGTAGDLLERVQVANPLSWEFAVPSPLRWKARNPLAVKMPIWDWLFGFCCAVFLVGLIPLFFWVAEPALLGKTPVRIWADSPVFLWVAGVDVDPGLLLEEHSSQLVVPAGEVDWTTLVSLGSNYLGPVAIGILARTNFGIMLVNYALFFAALYYLFKLKDIRRKLLVTLILIDPFLTMSILTVNKEIIVLLAVALFAYYLEKGSWLLVPPLLAVSFIGRWEQAAFVLLWILLASRLNPLRNHRLVVIAAMVVALSILSPQLKSVSTLWTVEGNAINILNSLQLNYMYFLVLIPKFILSSAQTLIYVPGYSKINWYDLSNGAFMLVHEALMVGVCVAVILSRRLRLRSDIVYAALLFTVMFCIAPLAQPRYFYAVYLFACIELARRREAAAPYPWELWLRQHADSLVFARRNAVLCSSGNQNG